MNKVDGFLTVAALIFMVQTPVLAQTTVDVQANAQEKGIILEEVLVTGSRITNPNLTSTAPITSMNADAIRSSGRTNVEDIVSQIPSLIGSDGNNEDSSGQNFLNLRNLGPNRTLTLVDGKRFVSGAAGSSAVDTNVIPTALIERVDVLTGGASAIYGADAVTGVVNFVLRDDFQGLSLNTQYGVSEEGDADDQVFSVAAGKNFADGRGNVAVTYYYGNKDPLAARDRDFASAGLLSLVNNQDGGLPAGVFRQGVNDAFFSDQGTLIDPFGIFSAGFYPDGSPFIHGENVGGGNGTSEVGGNGIPQSVIFNDDLIPGNERHIVSLRSHFDVSDRFKPYVNLDYSQFEAFSEGQQSLTVGLPVSAENPFLPGGAFSEVLAFGAGTPFGPPIFINRFDIDAGGLNQTIKNDTTRIVVGAKGALSESLKYDVYLNYGKAEGRTNQLNRFDDRYFAAIDAVDNGAGQVVCRSSLDPSSFNRITPDSATAFNPSGGAVTFAPGASSGCIPYNPFAFDDNENAAARDWIFQRSVSTDKSEQFVVSGFVAGDSSGFGLNLPAGSIDYVVGAEYREEKSQTNLDPVISNPRAPSFVVGSDVSGKYDVTEVFAEVSVPIFDGVGLGLEELTIDGALRLSDYSTVGSTETWKTGLIWKPVETVTLRGTVSQSVRAPNISELFAPLSRGFFGLSDPCDIANVNDGAPSRISNCAQALTAAGVVDPSSYEQTNLLAFTGISGGNPALREETADTSTVGVILRPTFLENLTVTVDYYEIDIEGAVINPTTQAIFDACYDGETLDNIFCALTSRALGTGFPNSIELQAINVGALKTSGIDYGLSYFTDVTNYGQFGFSLNGSYLRKLDIQSTATPVVDDEAYEFNTLQGGLSPKHVVNADLNWSIGKFDLNYGINYHSSVLRLENEVRERASEIQENSSLKSFINHELQIGFRIGEGSRIYAGVSNLTNEKPDIGLVSGPVDPTGRFFYAGIDLNFADAFNK